MSRKTIEITASGPVGSGKSAVLGEIEILCRALNLDVSYASAERAQSEKNMTHADWVGELAVTRPVVVLKEMNSSTSIFAESNARLSGRRAAVKGKTLADNPFLEGRGEKQDHPKLAYEWLYGFTLEKLQPVAS